MKKQIVHIVIESINREYDNALLLKCALEKHGYLVRLFYKEQQISLRKCDVLIVPNCYTTANYEDYRYKFNCPSGHIISMQYEQVLSKKIEENGIHIPKGRAVECTVLCWGDNAYSRLLRNGITKNQLYKVGAIQLDFQRDDFERYWDSKETIAKLFSIPIDKKWLLFISSFSYVDNEKVYTALKADNFNDGFINSFAEVSTKSQKAVLKWFDHYLEENNDIVILYRPHPLEENSIALREVMDKFPNRLILVPTLSVKQWINISDVIITWFSTSIVECYLKKKNCIIVRPYEINKEEDAAIFIGGRYCMSYDEFCHEINHYETTDFPIKQEVIMDYYDMSDIPAYKRIAHVVNQINLTPEKREINFNSNRIKYLFKKNYISKYIIKYFYSLLYRAFGFTIKNAKMRNTYFIRDWEVMEEHKRETKFDQQVKENILNVIIDNN